MTVRSIVTDMEDVERAYARVVAELDKLDATDLAPMNVDLVSATSIVLGVSDRVRSFRDRMAQLPELDLANIDSLVDYAKATWFLYLTQQPAPAPAEAEALMAEATALRAKLLVWTVPLVASGHLSEELVGRIREGSGHKDLPSDLIALVALYRSKWAEVESICGVTEADLNRAAELGTAVFGMVSRREQEAERPGNDGSLRLRRAWTRLDRAYAQCRRAIAYLRFAEGDVDEIAPNLRRNPGQRSRQPEVAAPPPGTAPTPTPATGAGNGGPTGGLGGGNPFVTGRPS